MCTSLFKVHTNSQREKTPHTWKCFSRSSGSHRKVISVTNSIFHPTACLCVGPQGEVENETGVTAPLEVSPALLSCRLQSLLVSVFLTVLLTPRDRGAEPGSHRMPAPFIKSYKQLIERLCMSQKSVTRN